MCLTNKDKVRLKVFERRIVGPRKRLMNIEINDILEEDVVKIIKLKIMRWYGHETKKGK